MAFQSDAHRRWWHANNGGDRLGTSQQYQSGLQTEADVTAYINKLRRQQLMDASFEAQKRENGQAGMFDKR